MPQGYQRLKRGEVNTWDKSRIGWKESYSQNVQ